MAGGGGDVLDRVGMLLADHLIRGKMSDGGQCSDQKENGETETEK